MTFWWRKAINRMKYVSQDHFDLAIGDIHQELGSFRHEFSDFRGDVATRFDEVITILRRLDQERVFTLEWIKRIESDVSLVKKHLKLA